MRPSFTSGPVRRHRVGTAVIEHISALGDRSVVGSDRFAEHVEGKIVSPFPVGKVVERKGHRIDALPLGIVAELDLRLVRPLHRDVRLRIDRIFDIGKPGALLPRRIGIAELIQRDGRRTHDLLIGKGEPVRLAELGLRHSEMVQNKRHRPRHIGRRHGRAAVFRPAARHGGSDLSAVRRDLRLELQRRRRPPGGECRHERPCLIVAAQKKLARPSAARSARCELPADLHGNGAGRDGVFIFAERHLPRYPSHCCK